MERISEQSAMAAASLGIWSLGDKGAYLLKTWTLEAKSCWEVLAPNCQVTCPHLSPFIYKMRVITYFSVYCEDEMR